MLIERLNLRGIYRICRLCVFHVSSLFGCFRQPAQTVVDRWQWDYAIFSRPKSAQRHSRVLTPVKRPVSSDHLVGARIAKGLDAPPKEAKSDRPENLETIGRDQT